ncbi:MAG TPA: condensation domain-containing protein [Thermoanaerobaculia bacterium]
MKAQDEFQEASDVEGIAVIGMAGRFPGAASIEQFWRNLREGVELVSALSDADLLAAGIDEETLRDPRYVKAGALLDGIDRFDAPFFRFNPREAAVLDPQHRLLLECAWEALENAGHDGASFGGPIGVFAGSYSSTYLMFNLVSNPELLRSVGFLNARILNDKDFLATRISYLLDLKGPSLCVQTACSTSLVATHLACRSLLSFECDLALAGGVSITALEKTGYSYQDGGIFSPDGHCRPFDARANGTVPGSGAGIVVLRRLADALEDGDRVLAVIRGTAINNDGSGKVGFTAPSVDAQAQVIAAALDFAEVSPRTITYVEAHGTGTAIGDPMEVAALTQVFGEETEDTAFCGIGSLKSNIGHLDAAAGVASLIKTVLALEHGEIPPSLNCETPSPEIGFESTPFHVVSRLTPWRCDGPRRAGVSSFGVGGTNAHAVLEESPPREPSGPSRPWQLLVLSARTAPALEAVATRLAAHLKGRPDLPLADVAHTLCRGRRAWSHRRVVVCRSSAEAVAALEDRESEALGAVHDPGKPEVAFLFPGQGSQHAGMARELYAAEAGFREVLDRCAKGLMRPLGVDLRTLLFPRPEDAAAADERLQQTAFAQPALFSVSYALGRLWMDWGVQPSLMVGHSVGELVAACLAGVFSLEDALALVAARGRLVQELPSGAMLAVPLPEESAAALARDGISLAAVNGPRLCVLSGEQDVIARLHAGLSAQGLSCRLLKTSHAFHSAMVEPAVERFAAEVRRVRLTAPQLPFLSGVTGRRITDAEATDPGYWAQHLRRPVRFADAVAELLREPDRVLLEVGPGEALSTLVKLQATPVRMGSVVPSLPHPRDSRSDFAAVLTAVGRLWLSGVGMDWAAFFRGERRHRVELPTYPFERQRYWVTRRRVESELPSMQGSDFGIEVPDLAASADAEPARRALEGETERRVAAVWGELLGIRGLCPDDDFFALGGHSLLATQAASRLRDALGVELPLEVFFEHRTVRGLAAHIEAAKAARADAELEPAWQIPPAPRDRALPLSFAQQQLWVLQNLHPQSSAYNSVRTFRLRGELDARAVAMALREVVARHEVLRTTFTLEGGWPVQSIATCWDLPTPVIDLGALDESRREAEARSLLARDAGRPFDLARGPVLRCLLLRLGDHEHVLQLNIHHVATDGWSDGVLLGELAVLYTAFRADEPSPLPTLPIQYADFAVWQRNRLSAEALERLLSYWRARLAGLTPLSLRPAAELSREIAADGAGTQPVTLDAELSDALRTAGLEEGCTLFMVLLALFNVLLCQRSGQSDIALGSPVAGRSTAETEKLIGVFVNTLVLRTDLSGDPDFRELLARVRETTLGAQAHHDLPYERLVVALRGERDTRAPLFNVWFVLHNTPTPSLSLPSLDVSGEAVPEGGARHDLSLALGPERDGIGGQLTYRVGLFTDLMVRDLAEDFVTVAQAVAHDSSVPVSALIARLGEAEEQRRAERRAALKTTGLARLQAVRRKVEVR